MSTTTQIPPNTAAQYARIVQNFRDSLLPNHKNILLIEPNYANKYPPIGLMKIATYHRMLGDKVRFFKGDLKDLVIDELWQDCLQDLIFIDPSVNWNVKQIYKNKK